MKIGILGGGPSGLFLSILLKRARPAWEVIVVEQNAADATFGFGVVLADTGLTKLRAADPATMADLEQRMMFSTGQTIALGAEALLIKRPGTGGAISRLTLLESLQASAQGLGVRMHFNCRFKTEDDLRALELGDADVIVGADGINSIVRSWYEAEFGTTTRTLTNHFAWYGTTRCFEDAALVFREHRGGHFVAHYYRYSDSMSTFVAECTHDTWQRLGLDLMSDPARQALFEEIYEPELEGHPLISNRSIWRQFPIIRNTRWSCGRFVLMGDALASAHPSIGSGTRLAMEDAIALATALLAPDVTVPEALQAYEATHRPQKTKLIDAAEKSCDWYERIAQWMGTHPLLEFIYSFYTRTGRIDEARMRGQFPDLMTLLDADRRRSNRSTGASMDNWLEQAS